MESLQGHEKSDGAFFALIPHVSLYVVVIFLEFISPDYNDRFIANEYFRRL